MEPQNPNEAALQQRVKRSTNFTNAASRRRTCMRRKIAARRREVVQWVAHDAVHNTRDTAAVTIYRSHLQVIVVEGGNKECRTCVLLPVYGIYTAAGCRKMFYNLSRPSNFQRFPHENHELWRAQKLLPSFYILDHYQKTAYSFFTGRYQTFLWFIPFRLLYTAITYSDSNASNF